MGEPSLDPDDLLRAARAHDASALGRLLELYRRYLNLLARLGINRQLQGKLDPSDLVQETFLEAHRDFPQFRGTTESELRERQSDTSGRSCLTATHRCNFGPCQRAILPS